MRVRLIFLTAFYKTQMLNVRIMKFEYLDMCPFIEKRELVENCKLQIGIDGIDP